LKFGQWIPLYGVDAREAAQGRKNLPKSREKEKKSLSLNCQQCKRTT